MPLFVEVNYKSNIEKMSPEAILAMVKEIRKSGEN